MDVLKIKLGNGIETPLILDTAKKIIQDIIEVPFHRRALYINRDTKRNINATWFETDNTTHRIKVYG